MATEDTTNIFSDTLSPRDIQSYTLMRGVTDFSNLSQYDLYETGYSFLINLSIPKFLKEAKKMNDTYKNLINNYCHIIEYDFRGLSGIEDITTETGSLTNGIDELNVITRVREQGAGNFSMNYYERSGSILTKTHELFLRGIKDPRTQFKRYLGLITGARNTTNSSSASTTSTSKTSSTTASSMEANYANEVFNYMLIVTDNTGFNVEKAYILAACQPTTANTSIYQVERGQIGFSEINIAMNGFPITGRVVNNKATSMLTYINKATCFDEMQFGYNILTSDNSNIESIGGSQTASPIYSNGDITNKADNSTRDY